MLKKPIRVLYIIGGGEFGGAEQHVISLIRGFAAKECTAHVVCFYDAKFSTRLQEAGIPVTVLAQQGLFTSFRTLRKIIHNFRPDIIHTHGVRANVFGRIAGPLSRIPVITTVHSKFALDYPNRTKRTILYSLEKVTRPFVHTYIAVSNAIKQELIREHVKENKIQVIYNGIDTDYFVPDIENPRTKKQKSSELPTVVTVARFHPVKGHKYLLEAIGQVSTPARYIFVGDGELRTEIEQEIKEHQLPVELMGHQDVILPYYQMADLVVQPSLSEGFSLSVAEALSCGVPVVATRAGGVMEIASHMKQGVTLVEAGDAFGLAAAIDHMLQSPKKPNRDAIIETFSTKQMCKHTYALYKKVITKYPS